MSTPYAAEERRYQIFVSSTFRDLTKEREAVLQAILELKAFADGMELFPSANSEQWEFIKREIESSDYYIVIVAGKYGSLAPDGISYTEKEYDYAIQIGKPVFAFIHHDTDRLEARLTESDPTHREKLESFRKKILKSKLVKLYTDPQDLKHAVYRALDEDFRRCPRLGWVRTKAKTIEGGLVEFKKGFSGLSYDEMIRESRKLTIVLNDGRSWVDSHREAIQERISRTGLETTFLFIHPKSDFLPILLRKNGKRRETQIDELRRSLLIISERQHGSLVKVQGHYLFNTYAMFLGDQQAIVMPYFINEGGQLPVCIFENDSKVDSLYFRYKRDAEILLEKSVPITMADLD